MPHVQTPWTFSNAWRTSLRWFRKRLNMRELHTDRQGLPEPTQGVGFTITTKHNEWQTLVILWCWRVIVKNNHKQIWETLNFLLIQWNKDILMCLKYSFHFSLLVYSHHKGCNLDVRHLCFKQKPISSFGFNHCVTSGGLIRLWQVLLPISVSLLCVEWRAHNDCTGSFGDVVLDM